MAPSSGANTSISFRSLFFVSPNVISVYILFLSHLHNGWSGTVCLVVFVALCSVTCQARLAWKFIKELGGFIGCVK